MADNSVVNASHSTAVCKYDKTQNVIWTESHRAFNEGETYDTWKLIESRI